MADRTRIDPDLARAEIARLKGIASRFQSAVDKIKSDAAQHAGCWGNDEFGQAFGKSYEPGEKQMLDNSDQMKEGVTGTAKQVEQAVEAFEKTDEINARNLTAAEVRESRVTDVSVDQVRGGRGISGFRGAEAVEGRASDVSVDQVGGVQGFRGGEVVVKGVEGRASDVSVDQVGEVHDVRLDSR